MSLTCDTCGRTGTVDDGIESGGECQEPCEGTVRGTFDITVLLETLGGWAKYGLTTADEWAEWVDLHQDEEHAFELAERIEALRPGESIIENAWGGEFIQRYSQCSPPRVTPPPQNSLRADRDIIEYAEKCAADATVVQDGETYWHSVTRLSARDVLRLCELARLTVPHFPRSPTFHQSPKEGPDGD